MRMRMIARLIGGMSMLGLAAHAGCTGDIGNGDGVVDAEAQLAVISGAKRLSRVEYDNTLRDLLSDTSLSGFAMLPEDVTDPFDNDYHSQKVSPALVQSAETLAHAAALRALADPAVLDAIVPCTPTGAGDGDCLKEFVTTWGRRALRRPITSDEADHYVEKFLPFATERDDFNEGVGMVIEAMLQDVEFLYRVELGKEVANEKGVFRLDDFEVATRMSYFLTGTTPTDELLDIAAADGLSSSEDVRSVAVSLLENDTARERVDRFHALWMSYHQLPHSAELTGALREEAKMLVERVVYEQDGDYFDLFRSTETWLTPTLAEHYGYSGDGWFTYPDDRRGILSTGAFLSAGTKFSDTSPTQRGLFVRTRLLCLPKLLPPPDVNVDAPPEPTGADDCKLDTYKQHGGPGCKGCHESLDGIGFGLEQYDLAGRYRTAEEGRPECLLPGDGAIPGTGEFNGPAELAELLISDGSLEACVVKQVFRFAMGRESTADDDSVIGQIATNFAEHSSFKSMLLDVVEQPAFLYRRQEEGGSK